jgi:hypothetical protein
VCVYRGVKTNKFYEELQQEEKRAPETTLGSFIRNHWDSVMQQSKGPEEEEQEQQEQRRILTTRHHEVVGAAVQSGVEAGKRLLSRLRDEQQTWTTRRTQTSEHTLNRVDSSKGIWTGRLAWVWRWWKCESVRV